MGRTRTQLRQLVGRNLINPFLSGTNTIGTSTIDHAAVLGGFPADYFIGASLLLVNSSGSAASITEVQVTASTAAGVITFTPTVIVNGADGYEVLPYPATSIHQAIDDAIFEAYDRGWLRREMWLSHWLSGSPIYNGGMDYWTSNSASATALDGWDGGTTGIGGTAGTLLRVQHTSASVYLQPGLNAATLLSGTIATYGLTEQYERFLADFRGYTVNLRAWLYATAASVCRVQVWVDGAVGSSSSYHTGGSAWEVVGLDGYNISRTTNRVNVAANVAATTASTTRLGAIWLENGPRITEYPFPISLMPDGPDAVYLVPPDVRINDATAAVTARAWKALSGWEVVRLHNEAADSEMGVLTFFRDPPPQGYKLVMRGGAILTLPTANTDVVEVSQLEAQLLAKMAAKRLVETDFNKLSVAGQEKKREWLARINRDIERLSRGHGGTDIAVPLPPGW